MQWHPIFAHLLRPLVEGHYEVRTGQTVGDVPRSSDVVLLRKASASLPPFHGLWSHLTPWNVLEYKGPTVSARFDELHDLIELGFGIHRRLNELQQKERRRGDSEGQAAHPDMDYPDVSFWYLVNHLGARFLAEAPRHLPGLQQVTAGLWQVSVFSHPLFLVSTQELEVERDSLPLHVLAGLADADKGTVKAVLQAEPALWPNYGPWLFIHEPALWREISQMATQQEGPLTLDFRPLADYLKETGGLKRFLEDVGIKEAVEAVGVKQAVEAVGVKEAVEAVGVKQAVEAVGLEQVWAALSPEERERLRRLAEQETPPKNDPT
jgi:hypothetical protein